MNKRLWTLAFALALALVLALVLALLPTGAWASAEAYEPFAFTDALGHEVEFAAPPERVAALYGSFAECVWLAGGNVVGATKDAVEEGRLGAEHAQIVGTVKQPSFEAILALDPDFVLLSANIASHRALGEALAEAGVTSAYFDVNHYTEYMAMMRVLTRAFGREDLYAAQAEAVEKPIEALLAEATPHRGTCLLLRAFASGVRSKGSDNLAGAMLRDMGLDNIADGDDTLLEEMNLEAILAANPEYIFVTVMGGGDGVGESCLEGILADPAWAEVEAVKRGRVYLLPAELFHYKPNARWSEAYQYLEAILDS